MPKTTAYNLDLSNRRQRKITYLGTETDVVTWGSEGVGPRMQLLMWHRDVPYPRVRVMSGDGRDKSSFHTYAELHLDDGYTDTFTVDEAISEAEAWYDRCVRR